MRKAIIKKSKNFKFGQSLKKGEEVVISEIPIGNGNVKYMAFRNENDTLGMGVTASEFEYTEEAEFDVAVCRTAYAHRTITVRAKTRKEAETIALDEAGGLDFSENDADYTVNSVMERK